MNVEIHTIKNDDFYVAKSENDCRNEIDLSAYKSAVELNQVILMGCVIAKPI